MKYFVALNPKSGAGKCEKEWPHIRKKLVDAGIDFEYLKSEKHRQTIDHVKGAVKEGYRNIICVGGDGTLHHVVNGIMLQQELPTNQISVGMISLGTGNDWIKYYNIPSDYDKAIDVIKKGKTTLQDVGKLVYSNRNEIEYFMNFTGIGYDAYVVENTVNLKKYGQSAYMYGLLQCLFKFDAQQLRIEVDGKEVLNEKIFMLIAGLGKYAGGGMKFSPDAVIDDGWLDLTIGKNLSKTEIVFMIHKLFNGDYVHHPKVETYRAKNIKVTPLNPEVKAESDGELIGNGPFEISIIEKALRVFIP